jgi:hypothetical protein
VTLRQRRFPQVATCPSTEAGQTHGHEEHLGDVDLDVIRA